MNNNTDEANKIIIVAVDIVANTCNGTSEQLRNAEVVYKRVWE